MSKHVCRGKDGVSLGWHPRKLPALPLWQRYIGLAEGWQSHSGCVLRMLMVSSPRITCCCLSHMVFPPNARKLVTAVEGRAEWEDGAGVCMLSGLTLTLLFRSIPGKHVLRLLLALPEPAAAEPGQLPRPLHRQPSAHAAHAVRTAVPARPPCAAVSCPRNC